MFDEGELNEDPDRARKEVKALVDLMKGSNLFLYSAETHPLSYVFQSIWQRIVKVRFVHIPWRLCTYFDTPEISNWYAATRPS